MIRRGKTVTSYVNILGSNKDKYNGLVRFHISCAVYEWKPETIWKVVVWDMYNIEPHRDNWTVMELICKKIDDLFSDEMIDLPILRMMATEAIYYLDADTDL